MMMMIPVMTSCHSVGEVEHAEPVRQERQDEHAERHAEERADAAGQADAAEDHRGHHLELEAEAGEMHGRAEARGEQDAGDGGEQRADDEADEFHPPNAVAGKPRHLGVAADGIDLPPERPVAHHIHEGDEEDEGDDRRIGHDAEELLVAEREEAVEPDIVGDRRLAGVEIDAAAEDEEDAERHDQRVDADIGREVAVDERRRRGRAAARRRCRAPTSRCCS